MSQNPQPQHLQGTELMSFLRGIRHIEVEDVHAGTLYIITDSGGCFLQITGANILKYER